jgi:hypothetical protein
MRSVKPAFIGVDGKVRPIWRAMIFLVAAGFVVRSLIDWPFTFVEDALHLGPGFTPGEIGLWEFKNFLVALICTGAFALYERRRVDSYGLPISRAFSWHTLEGVLAGILVAGAVGLGMFLLGGMQIRGFALANGVLISYALMWLGAIICAGIAEEFLYRSYFQQTLWKAIGFWPSATVIALIFAAAHYFFKPGENIRDVITLVSLSLLISYSLLRTGTLWFAVGFHIAFDYIQLFVIGTPNGTFIPVGRLLDVRFVGPTWLTGGALGTEASFLMYPAIALLWLFIWRRYRANPPLNV